MPRRFRSTIGRKTRQARRQQRFREKTETPQQREMGRRKLNKSRAQYLKEKRDAQRLRYLKIKNDPVLREKQQFIEREKYKKKRESMTRKLKAEMTHRERERQKKIWRKWNDTRREKLLKAKIHKNSLGEPSHDDLLNLPSAVCEVLPLPIPEPLADDMTMHSPQSACDDFKPNMYQVPVHGPTPEPSNERLPASSNSSSSEMPRTKQPYSECLSEMEKCVERTVRIKQENELNDTDQEQPPGDDTICRCLWGCRELTYADKLTVFENFNAQSYIQQSYFLVKECVRISDIKRRTVDGAVSRRQCSPLYYVPLEDRTVRVCKQTLCDTLEISPKRLQILQNKMKLGESLEDKRGTHTNRPNKMSSTKKRHLWDQSAMEAAVKTVTDGRMGYVKASRVYNVPQTTLKRRVKKCRDSCITTSEASRKEKLGLKPVFTTEQEKEFVNHVLLPESRMSRLSVTGVRRLAYQFAERNGIKHPFSKKYRTAGARWVSDLRKRHPEIFPRAPEQTSLAKYQLVVKQDVLDDLIEVKYEVDDNHALYPYVQLDADESSHHSPEPSETVTLYAVDPPTIPSTSEPAPKRLKYENPDDEVPIEPLKCSTPDVFVDNPMADDGEDEARALGDFVSAEMRRIRSDERRKSLRKTIEEAVKAMVEEDEKEFFQDPATDPLS